MKQISYLAHGHKVAMVVRAATLFGSCSLPTCGEAVKVFGVGQGDCITPSISTRGKSVAPVHRAASATAQGC